MEKSFVHKKIIDLIQRDDWRAMDDSEKLKAICVLSEEGVVPYPYLALFLDETRTEFNRLRSLNRYLSGNMKIMTGLFVFMSIVAAIGWLR